MVAMAKVSERILTIYENLIHGEPVWDFCCDHGYLGISAYRSGHFPEVHFVDQVPHIIQKLETDFAQKHFDEESSQRAFFWAQSGESIHVPLSGTAVIAGVGTHTIQDILLGLYAKPTVNVSRWILSSHRHEEKLEQFLASWNVFQEQFSLTFVREVVENGRNRKLLIFDKNL